MSKKGRCPVCLVEFVVRDVGEDKALICPVCGAKLTAEREEETAWQLAKFPQDPETEVRERLDKFAEQRKFTFNEDKEWLIEGLMSKHQAHGEHYCPCRIENIPENICPCLETRQGVLYNDACLCGLFFKKK